MTLLSLRAAGATIGSASGAAVSATWSTCGRPDGPVTLEATATDSSGQNGTASVQVVVGNARAVAPALTASPGNRSAKLRWTHCSQGATFDLYWGTDAGVTAASASIRAVQYVNVPAEPPAFVHSGLTNGVGYSYRLAARSGTTAGVLSNEVRVVAGCSGDGWCWVNPSPASAADLNAVWGSSSTDVWAVGDGGAILHWNGVILHRTR